MSNNKREFSRVSAYVPLAWRVVAPDEHAIVRCRISGKAAMAQSYVFSDPKDPVLGEWLKTIHEKLDTILRIITVQAEGFHTLPYRNVNISGSGISFSVNGEVNTGDIVEIKIVLSCSNLHQLYLYLYGEVVRVEPQSSGSIIAARFIQMDDAIRDEVVRFVFEREREILRERRKQEGLS